MAQREPSVKPDLPRPCVAVLIDLDGTLMDTVPDLAQAANDMRAELGLPGLPVQRIATFVGKGADVLVHRALSDDMHGQVDAERFAQGRVAFFRHYHAVNGRHAKVFEGVPAALQRLRMQGLRLACVTNKPREFTLPLLQRMGLDVEFEVVVAGDDVPEKKPHPAQLQEAARQLGVTLNQCVMLGDSSNDALAARRAGCPCVLVQTGYNESEPVSALTQAPGVWGVFDDLPLAVDAMLMHSTI